MGKVLRAARTDHEAVLRAVDSLSRQVTSLRGRHANVFVLSGTGAAFTQQDSDGSVWIDRDDNSFHYVVNGVERKITGTIV